MLELGRSEENEDEFKDVSKHRSLDESKNRNSYLNDSHISLEARENTGNCHNGKNVFGAILKGAGYFLLGVVLTVSHYVFDLIAAPLGTIARTVLGCKNLYSKTNPEGFVQHVWYIFKSLFLVIYNLIKLAFLLIYRATFGLIEHAVGIIKPMCCVFRGDKKYQVSVRTPIFENKFNEKNKFDASLCYYLFFAIAFVEFESLLFNNPENHGKFKRFFTSIWDKVHGKFGEFAKWLLLPKKIDSHETTKENQSRVQSFDFSSANDSQRSEEDIFDTILHPLLR